MRNLDECRSEIFRRSNERISKRRKTRNRILACCIPLLVCIAAFSAAALPSMMQISKDSAPESNEMLSGSGSAIGNLDPVYSQVEIMDTDDFPDHYQKITDIPEVNQIFTAIQGLYAKNESVPESSDGMSMESFPFRDYGVIAPGAEVSANTEYTITFMNEYGVESIFTLTGNKLTNKGTGRELILTDDQLVELNLVLGLTE